ncbi:uncharacterized protein [Salminus brasiliensis]|uniref:uncharacterized protein n=1 Tax=Salminus brasiliensis TaxID=930266 RepID=UPI003B82D6BE
MVMHLQWIQVIYIFCMFSDPVTSSNEEWKIKLERQVFTVETLGSIFINCTVEYPRPAKDKENIQAFWKAKNEGRNKCKRESGTFIFHPNSTLVMNNFQGKTNLTGNIMQNDCSLLISKIQNTNIGQYYLRVETGSEQYSFCQKMITINVKGYVSNVTQSRLTSQDFTSTVQGTSSTESVKIVYISVPLILLAVVITMVVVFLLRQRKRRRYPARQNSNYYANFHRPCEMSHDGPELPEKFEKEQEPPPFTPKDEPIYGNVQGESLEKPADSDQMENIYSNVGCGVQW